MITLQQSSHRQDLTGDVFGRLLVINYAETRDKGVAVWQCLCECGRLVDVPAAALRSGHTKSCGCLKLDKLRSRAAHGYAGKRVKRLYVCWQNMKSRAENPNNPRHKYYFDKGITVCKSWQKFDVFKQWAITNGYNDDLVLDRIDSDRGYSPKNCRWVTRAFNSSQAVKVRTKNNARRINDNIAGG